MRVEDGGVPPHRGLCFLNFLASFFRRCFLPSVPVPCACDGAAAAAARPSLLEALFTGPMDGHATSLQLWTFHLAGAGQCTLHRPGID